MILQQIAQAERKVFFGFNFIVVLLVPYNIPQIMFNVVIFFGGVRLAQDERSGASTPAHLFDDAQETVFASCSRIKLAP